jgi:hypothetical protein
MKRRCGDEEDDADAVRGATSRASGELSRLWRLETHHQEALTGTTATWGWEAATENTVSKQTPVFIKRRGISRKKKKSVRRNGSYLPVFRTHLHV